MTNYVKTEKEAKEKQKKYYLIMLVKSQKKFRKL